MVGKARVVLGLAILVGLAGCDQFAFDDPPSDADEAYLALQAETLALKEVTDKLEATPGFDLPVEGSASYSGTARIGLDPLGGGPASDLIGDVEITVEFADTTLSGRAENFYGTIEGGEVTAFEGQLFLSQGVIDPDATGDLIGANLNGTLSGGGDTLVIDGGVSGNFLGDPSGMNVPPEAILLGSTENAGFTLNGDEVTGGLDIIGVLPD